MRRAPLLCGGLHHRLTKRPLRGGDLRVHGQEVLCFFLRRCRRLDTSDGAFNSKYPMVRCVFFIPFGVFCVVVLGHVLCLVASREFQRLVRVSFDNEMRRNFLNNKKKRSEAQQHSENRLGVALKQGQPADCESVPGEVLNAFSSCVYMQEEKLI
jgi:hypothetical protein